MPSNLYRTVCQRGFSAVVGTVKGSANSIIGFINAIIGAWNALEFRFGGQRIELPFGQSFTVPSINIGTPDIPTIPTLQSGAFVQRGGLAILDQGERVQPATVARGGGGGDTINFIFNGTVSNERDLETMIIRTWTAARANGDCGLMPTEHFEHLTPQLFETEVVEDKGRILKRVRAVATFPVTVIAGQVITAVRGNAVRSALLKTIAGLVTAKGQLFVATADNDTGALNPPGGTGTRTSSVINASTRVLSWVANVNSLVTSVAASKLTRRPAHRPGTASGDLSRITTERHHQRGAG